MNPSSFGGAKIVNHSPTISVSSSISNIFSTCLLFTESVPGVGIEDMLDDFVTFFIAGRTKNNDYSNNDITLKTKRIDKIRGQSQMQSIQ